MHQPSTRPSAQRISRFLKNYKSDPSTFPEFGQIKEGVSKSDLPWRSKRIKPDYITGVKHAPSPLSMLGNDDIEDETEPGFVPLEVREVCGVCPAHPVFHCLT